MSNITRDELLIGKVAGLHKLDQPLTGYKKIKCICLSATVDAIAELQIPKDSTIVRPNEKYGLLNALDSGEVWPSKRLRTDCAIVKNIEYPGAFPYSFLMANFSSCVCYSNFDKSFNYKIGHKPNHEEMLDTNIDSSSRTGINFYISKDGVKDY